MLAQGSTRIAKSVRSSWRTLGKGYANSASPPDCRTLIRSVHARPVRMKSVGLALLVEKAAKFALISTTAMSVPSNQITIRMGLAHARKALT